MIEHPGPPRYAALPAASHGGRSAWGVFGHDNDLGTLNLITQDSIRDAAAIVQAGKVFSLNAAVDEFDPPLDNSRSAAKHRLTEGTSLGTTDFDDVVDNFYTQITSQWDALGHVAYVGDRYYNDVPGSDVRAGLRNTIDAVARRGIAGRGVLLDVAAHCEYLWTHGGPGRGSVAIRVEDLERARASAGVLYSTGCILMVHTGFVDWYRTLNPGSRRALSADLTSPGLEHTEQMAEYLWDNRISAVATDTFGVEVWPPDLSPEAEPFGFLHRVLIGQLGFSLGELWDLGGLAADCRDDGRYECMLVSAPLNLRGGVGSPANALALK